MSLEPGAIAAYVAHARHVAVGERTGFASRLRAAIAGRGLILETCHRVEAYVSDRAITDAISSMPMPAGARELRGEHAVRHAISVAVGRDSVVVGEDQVLHQLRTAFDGARPAGLDPALARLFTTALRAGREARSWRTGPERSLATLAISAIESRVGPLDGQPVLVVGAGRMGRMAARAVAARGASVVIANRTPAAARALAAEVGGRAVPFDPGNEAATFAGALIAIGGPWPIATATAAVLVDSAVPVVDLSVPPAVAADVAAMLGPCLVTADDLARMGSEVAELDDRSARRLDSLIDRSTVEFLAWLDARDRRATAAELAGRADRAREAELAELWRRLPELDPDSRAAIDAMTRHFAERLLREPLEQLGQDVDGAAEKAVREAFAL